MKLSKRKQLFNKAYLCFAVICLLILILSKRWNSKILAEESLQSVNSPKKKLKLSTRVFLRKSDTPQQISKNGQILKYAPETLPLDKIDLIERFFAKPPHAPSPLEGRRDVQNIMEKRRRKRRHAKRKPIFGKAV